MGELIGRHLVRGVSAILIMALTLYTAAVWIAVARGPDTFACGLLAGAGSIALGVWTGIVVTSPSVEDG